MIISFKNNDGNYEEGYVDGQNSIISTFSSTTVTVNGNYGSSANPLSSITVNIAQTGHTDEELEEAFDSGYNSGETHQKSLLSSTAITENGSYQMENGWSGVTVNVDTASTYNSGYTEGMEDQKALLVSTAFTENGNYSRENGWSGVSVNVDTASTYNSGYTSGYTDGYESGSTDEKSKLSAVTITANTAITVSEGGYSGITVNVSDNFAKLIDKSITEAVIPNGIEKIENYVFDGCTSLSSVTMPNGITSIENYAFGSCTSLSSITMPNEVTKIGPYAFSGCSSLSSVTMPNALTSIGISAFAECTSLSSITIPDGVTILGLTAFRNCSSLKTIYAYPTTEPRLGNIRVFEGVPSTGRVYYPSGSNYNTWKSNQFISGWTFTAM